MRISGTGHVYVGGPPRVVRVRLAVAGQSLVVVCSIWADRKLRFPIDIFPDGFLPADVEMTIEDHDGLAPRQAVPLYEDGSMRFTTYAQCHKGSFTFRVPSCWARAMEYLRWPDIVEARVVHENKKAVFPAHVRRRQLGTYMPVIKSAAADLGLADKSVLTIELHSKPTLTVPKTVPAPASVAEGLVADGVFDWSRVMTRDTCASEDFVEFVGQRGTLRMFRETEEVATAWLLGFYQAEGSKQGMDFHVANANPFLLRSVAGVLDETFGIARSALFLQPIYRDDGAADEAARRFQIVRVPSASPRYSSSRGGVAATLHVRHSLLFSDAVKTVLRHLIDTRLAGLSAAGAVAFCLGFLDGDGTITRTATEVSLRAFGSTEERVAVYEALGRALGWEGWSKKGATYAHPSDGHRTTLGLEEIVDLLDAGAFRWSMNRVKLLYALMDRSGTIARCGPGTVRWGYANSCGEFTDKGRKVLDARRRYQAELEHVERACPEARAHKGITREKGSWYPLLRAEPRGVAYQRELRDRFSRRDPRRVDSLEGCRVEQVSNEEALKIISRYEWLGTIGRPLACYGLRASDSSLLGVATFGRGPGPTAGHVCGPESADSAVCLERGACVHFAPKNAASHLIRAATRLAARDHGWRIFFAFADEEAGEIGTVYQASNWKYLGKGLGSDRPVRRFVSPDGTPRSGRRVSTPNDDLLSAGWLLFPGEAKHKYVWFEGSRSERKKLERSCRYPFLPYPKRVKPSTP